MNWNPFKKKIDKDLQILKTSTRSQLSTINDRMIEIIKVAEGGDMPLQMLKFLKSDIKNLYISLK